MKIYEKPKFEIVNISCQDEILSSDGNIDDDLVVIPETFDGKSVTGISANAFNGASFKNIYLPMSIVKIGANAFENCNNLEKVYYKGSSFDWINAISKNLPVGNSALDNATRYYYSESKPSSGYYWHYVNGVITEWVV